MFLSKRRSTSVRHALVGAGHEKEPLAAYVVAIGAFLVTTTASIAIAVARERAPRRIAPADVLLLGLASTRVSRLVTRDKAARALRAPFTDVRRGFGLVAHEEPRRGPMRAIGELVTCPRCVGLWASAALTVGFVFAPRPTRIVSALLAAAAVSDYANTKFVTPR